MSKLAISIGDLNGIGPEIALRAHRQIIQWCDPVYCIHKEVMFAISELLEYEMPHDISCVASFSYDKPLRINPGCINAQSGAYSYESFMQAVRFVQSGECKALVTLPIHKKAWHEAQIPWVGHTQALSSYFGIESIMMLGCESLFVALFTDHIALEEVSKYVNKERVREFLLRFAQVINLDEPCCVLGLNPHCGDEGIMGGQDGDITLALKEANEILQKEVFYGAYPPDSAFSPFNRKKFRYFVSMYHDVGLAPLKALYFEQSINVSLGLPIIRTSVDHGVAYDRAYKKGGDVNLLSYFNAVQYALKKDYRET